MWEGLSQRIGSAQATSLKSDGDEANPRVTDRVLLFNHADSDFEGKVSMGSKRSDKK